MSYKFLMPLAILGGFLSIWILSGYLLAKLSGWDRLSDEFRAGRKFDGSWAWFTSVQMRYRITYSNVIHIGFDEYGLHLKVLFPFRIGHPRLFIPWNEIQILALRKHFLGASIQPLVLGNTAQIRFNFSSRKAERVFAQYCDRDSHV